VSLRLRKLQRPLAV